MADEITEKENSGMVVLPENALVKESEESGYAIFNMPRGSEYSGYRFLMDLNDVTKNEDGTVSFPLKGEVLELRANGTKINIPTNKARSIFNAAAASDFIPESYKVTIPSNAVYDKDHSGTRLLMPYDSEYKGCFCSVLNSVIYKNDEGKTELVLEDWMQIPVRLKDGTCIRISAKEFAEIMEKGRDSYADRKNWVTITLSKDAILDKHEKQTRFRMPSGKYYGFSYYLPNGMIRDMGDGTVLITLSETRAVDLINFFGDKVVLSAKRFKDLTDKKNSEYYPAS